MSKLNEYNLMVAMLTFNESYKRLVAASSKLTDYDLTELYPFYLLDFEKIQPAVSQWCLYHASVIMAEQPDRVVNPACILCESAGLGIDNAGVCIGDATCVNFPFIAFSVDAVYPSILKYTSPGSIVDKTNAVTVYLAYIELLKARHIIKEEEVI